MVNFDLNPDYFRTHLFNGISLAYIDSAGAVSSRGESKAIIILLHGFPQCSYQFRNVVPFLTEAGYRVIVPDYRGAGESSKPLEGFSKVELAADIIMLLDELSIPEPVHVVGHDIGGMIGFALASRWPDRVISLCVCESLLPGTTSFATQQADHRVDFFHFSFHCVPNLPEALLQGREKTYIEFFINKYSYRVGAFSHEHIQRYANAYSQPGALRCALGLYRALEKDAEDNTTWIRRTGKCKVPCLVVGGEHSQYGEYAETMALEMMEEKNLSEATVQGAGHFLSEENPAAFAEVILEFVKEQGAPPLINRVRSNR